MNSIVCVFGIKLLREEADKALKMEQELGDKVSLVLLPKECGEWVAVLGKCVGSISYLDISNSVDRTAKIPSCDFNCLTGAEHDELEQAIRIITKEPRERRTWHVNSV